MLTILVIGATGNTGKAVMQNLPAFLGDGQHRTIGLTRDLHSPVSRALSQLPNVEMEEKDWTSINAAWLKERKVTRAYIASHNLPHQFNDESMLNVALLTAGVKYVVRVSTDPAFLGPASPVYYGRTHWAIECQLSQPEFQDMHWTSLQPNMFTGSAVTPAIDWIKEFRKTGKQSRLRFTIASDAPIGLVNPEDVGLVGARLLALEDSSSHNQKRYILSGPEEVTGRMILDAVEEYTGVKVENVLFSDMQGIDDLVKSGYAPNTIASIRAAMDIVNSGLSSVENCPTSKDIQQLVPQHTFLDYIHSIVKPC